MIKHALTRMAVIMCGAAALLTTTGCQEEYYTGPTPGLGDNVPAPDNDPRIAILSPELQAWLAFQPPIVTRTPTDTLMVEVPMRNTTYEQYQLEYRFRFFDDYDRELEPMMSWRHLPAYPKQTTRMKASSLTSDASNWRLEVQWAR